MQTIVFRLLGFEHKDTFVVLTSSFKKKDQKISKPEIDLAIQNFAHAMDKGVEVEIV